ncbi:MAG: hypothetical protein ACRD33_00660 [Candidatus Acidiferrales bacterium]
MLRQFHIGDVLSYVKRIPVAAVLGLANSTRYVIEDDPGQFSRVSGSEPRYWRQAVAYLENRENRFIGRT